MIGASEVGRRKLSGWASDGVAIAALLNLVGSESQMSSEHRLGVGEEIRRAVV